MTKKKAETPQAGEIQADEKNAGSTENQGSETVSQEGKEDTEQGEEDKTDNPGLIPKSKETTPGKKVRFIVIHCSASDRPEHDNIETIRAWHKSKGFKDVGYHFYIRQDGTIEIGRPLDDDGILESEEIGAHTLGINQESIGICLGGVDIFSPRQFESLGDIVETILATEIDPEAITGHNYWTDKKTCPNFDWREWVGTHYPDLLPPEKKVKR